MKKITVIGGGTGTFVVLSDLKNYPLDLGVIVTMMDSGGSTGRLRDQLGVLPPGDLRQCLVALSEAPLLWRKLFLYRFENGDLAGHNFGNLFLSALEKVTNNYDEVIDTASFVLKTKGSVIPVTFHKTHMCVKYESGQLVKGEGNIDKNFEEKTRVVDAFLEPPISANPKAIKRILESDYLVIGPGDMYATIVPILLVDSIAKYICQSKTKIVYIMNLMSKSGQTTNYNAFDHISDLQKYLGRYPDIVILNNEPIPKDIISWYTKYHEEVIVDNLKKSGYSGQIIKENLIDNNKYPQSKADRLVDPRVRSILRHDSKKLAKLLSKILI